ncbi:MAG: sulfatase [Planctomycetota bacterium]|jgi:arylsulfatase A-like enzyme|nr:sulfatase [Planctomycetota bacterium]
MPQRPNVIVITTHDSGRHFGCYGVETVHTPAIDALAADGFQFNRMFATSSICSPSRGSLLTGQYPQHNGLTGLVGGMWNWELTDPNRHLSHLLKGAGYETGLFGHHHETSDISKLGFDHVNAYLPEADEGEQMHALRVAQGVGAFLSESRSSEKPFYCQVGFFETHTPFSFGDVEPDTEKGVWVPPYAQDDSDATREHTAHLQGAIRRVDEAVQIITEALRKSGQEENTILLFNVDHGVELPRAKWTMYDAGLGIGFILRWPAGGVTGGKQCDWLLNNVDFLPSLAQWIDLDVPHEMDGQSFAHVVENGESHLPRDTVFALFVNAQTYMARTDRYKLIRNFAEGYEDSIPGGKRQIRLPARLYDLNEDPLELNNLSEDPDYADVLEDLNGRLWKWLQQVEDPILQAPVPTPYYRQAIADYHQWKDEGK